MTYKSSMGTAEAAAQIARRQRAESGEAYALRGMLCAVEGKRIMGGDEPLWRVALVERHRRGTVEMVRLADGTKLTRDCLGRIMLDAKGEAAHPVLVLERLRDLPPLPFGECVKAIKRLRRLRRPRPRCRYRRAAAR